jgi:hypothetical protein
VASQVVEIAAHDLAATVDVEGHGPRGIRDLDRRKAPLGIPQEATDHSVARSAAGGRDAHDPAAVIDAEDHGVHAGTRGIDGGEDAVIRNEPMSTIAVTAGDFAGGRDLAAQRNGDRTGDRGDSDAIPIRVRAPCRHHAHLARCRPRLTHRCPPPRRDC